MKRQATAEIRVTFTYDPADYSEESARERIAFMLAGRTDNPDFPALSVDAVQAVSGFEPPPERAVLQYSDATPWTAPSGAVYTDPVASAQDYARYAAAAMRAGRAEDEEFIADGATVSSYVHQNSSMLAVFTVAEGRPYPGQDAEGEGYFEVTPDDWTAVPE